MTTVKPPPATTHDPDEQTRRLTRRAYWMLPAFLFVYGVTSLVGLYVVIPLLGLEEGDLFLFARNAAGWAFEFLFLLIAIAPPAFGVLFATRALRRGGRAAARIALILNVALVLVMAYTFVDAIRMTYWPG